MSGQKFGLSGLAGLLSQAVRSNSSTLVFELVQGRGRFVFMMFMAEDDTDSRDKLFIYLRNTRVLLDVDLYGSYMRGGTHVYLKRFQVDAMISELQLDGTAGEPFSLERFLESLNALIPANLPLQVIVDTFRRVWPEARHSLAKFVDDALKTTLIGVPRLAPGKKPRERTLRKLYLHTNESTAAVTAFIETLKARGRTTAWSADPNAVSKSFAELAASMV